ncbi:hypothetical protein HDU96_000682 [Phlyctochytrium bullatum]|nr:hypothetical protein HDU96_000682 [Phlyctochytrium bullatum]
MEEAEGAGSAATGRKKASALMCFDQASRSRDEPKAAMEDTTAALCRSRAFLAGVKQPMANNVLSTRLSLVVTIFLFLQLLSPTSARFAHPSIQSPYWRPPNLPSLFDTGSTVTAQSTTPPPDFLPTDCRFATELPLCRSPCGQTLVYCLGDRIGREARIDGEHVVCRNGVDPWEAQTQRWEASAEFLLASDCRKTGTTSPAPSPSPIRPPSPPEFSPSPSLGGGSPTPPTPTLTIRKGAEGASPTPPPRVLAPLPFKDGKRCISRAFNADTDRAVLQALKENEANATATLLGVGAEEVEAWTAGSVGSFAVGGSGGGGAALMWRPGVGFVLANGVPAAAGAGARVAANGSVTAKADEGFLPRAVAKVFWHVITGGDGEKWMGNLTREDVEANIAVLNQDYAGMIQFRLESLDYYDSPVWFHHTDDHDRMFQTLRVGREHDLNIFSVNFTDDGLLGYASFPWDLDETTLYQDGVVIKHDSVPGSPMYPFNGGKTLTHEVGHWLGLYHTFDGGCDDPDGDFVDDTPPVAEPNFTCTDLVDSCMDSYGLDRINNM